MVVEVKTNAAYHDGLVVSFTVGAPNDVESAPPTTESRAPWGEDGFVGSLTVVPSSGSSKDATLGVKIVLGVDVDSQACAPPAYKGCIVARRRLQYSPHERLELPIALYVQCKDVACDAASTCNLLGQCVSAAVDPGSCSGPNGCTITGDPSASMPPPADAGPADGTTDGNGDGGAPATDASAKADAADASVEAGADSGGAAGTPGIVDCGPGLTCDLTAGLACCFNTITLTGSCQTTGACAESPNMEYVACDGTEDCAPGELCCAVGPEATCTLNCGRPGPYDPVCHSTKTCASGTCASRAFAGGYYETCQ